MSLSLAISLGLSSVVIYKFLLGLWAVGYTPGPRPLFSPLTAFGVLLPANSLNPSPNWSWIWRRTGYFNQTHDIIAFVPWLVGTPTYYTSSLDIMKRLLGAEHRIGLIKPEKLTLAKLIGHSVASANGDVWKLHRRVVSPAFNSKTFEDVWKTARAVYQEVQDVEGWKDQDQIIFEEVNSFILKFAFTIICRCGFGFSMRWSRFDQSSMDFPNSLHLVSETHILRRIIPNWAYKLPFEKLRRIDTAWTTVANFISDAIRKRKNENLDLNDGTLSADILNCLVTSWIGNSKHELSESEVVSNMFSLLFAGHETTSSGLVTTLAYLSIYQDEQEKVFNEISRVLTEKDPSETIVLDDLKYTLYCFWEAQRLCPAAAFIPRQLTADIDVNISHPSPQTLHLREGSLIMFDLVGIFRNKGTFSDPETFRPERWANVSEHDVGTFGFGPRACIGRKFAQTEALAFLSCLLYDWKLEMNTVPGETRDHYEERVVGEAALSGTAFGLKSVPLKLTRRKK